MNTILLVLLGVIIAICVAIIAILSVMLSKKKESLNENVVEQALEKSDLVTKDELSVLRSEVNQNVNIAMKNLGDLLAMNIVSVKDDQNSRLKIINDNLVNSQQSLFKAMDNQNHSMEEKLKGFTVMNEQKLENIRTSMENKFVNLQNDNNKRLDEMRKTVDEKLQETLNQRISKSFEMVSERLQEVYKGLGEMRTLAAGVGDLKKVLGNVKNRGILGEIQLGAILEEILSKEQYMCNVATKKGSKAVVEFAVKIPTGDDSIVLMPIDSKFPADAYQNLLDAYDTGVKENVDEALKLLKTRVKSFAKDIHDKYIAPPDTTEFGIMFLPFEGLYSEVVRCGLVEDLQRNYKINIAGPSTMAALLNSIQMGYRTFAIQKRSNEVWKVLGAVKTEFDKFGKVLDSTQQRLDQANRELDQLIGVRTRQIQRTLKDVALMTNEQSEGILSISDSKSDDNII